MLVFWLVVIATLLVYLLYRLHRLEEYLKHFHLKNQEGAAALSRSRDPLLFLLAVLLFLQFLLDWLANGFTPRQLTSLLPLFLVLYLFLNGDDDD